ncbi:hypothetical protein OT109_09685 [Phycisphaeraceae bacterium D3-23]
MRTSRVVLAAGLSVVLTGTAATYGVYRWMSFRSMARSQTVERAEWEHGVALPVSANNVECLGEAYVLWAPDKGACTAFEMRKSDVPVLKSHLGAPISYPTFVPGNQQYQRHTFSWLNGHGPSEMLSCSSMTGDWLHVEIWPIDTDRVGVRMYTDWN